MGPTVPGAAACTGSAKAGNGVMQLSCCAALAVFVRLNCELRLRGAVTTPMSRKPPCWAHTAALVVRLCHYVTPSTCTQGRSCTCSTEDLHSSAVQQMCMMMPNTTGATNTGPATPQMCSSQPMTGGTPAPHSAPTNIQHEQAYDKGTTHSGGYQVPELLCSTAGLGFLQVSASWHSKAHALNPTTSAPRSLRQEPSSSRVRKLTWT